MDDAQTYQHLLDQMRTVYTAHPETSAFASFPQDVVRQTVTPFHAPCAEVFAQDTTLTSTDYPMLQNAIVAAGPIAQWRETYKGTDIGDTFMRQFGCYCIIGEGGPYQSQSFRAYMVYMPPGLFYPRHHHPAEEMYFVVSGSAKFQREGSADEVLIEGQTAFHASNQPHAMETLNEAVLCLVFWRNRFETPPVLTPADECLSDARC
jgi:quercetin dioxygenase-like cupin family protein